MMSERLEKIKEIDITPLCFYLDNMTNFDGKLLKELWKWLIKRVEALEEENDELAERVHKLALDWSELVDERNRYKQALEFYADEDNYCVSLKDDFEPILQDNGKTAQQALRGEEEK